MNALRVWLLLFLFLVSGSQLHAQSVAVPYMAPLGADEQLVDVAALSNGRLLVASQRYIKIPMSVGYSETRPAAGVIRLLAPNGEVLGKHEIGGSQQDTIRAIAVLSDGRIVAVGKTNSSDFPLIDPLFPAIQIPAPGGYAFRDVAFVAILAPDLSAIQRSTLLGGQPSDLARPTEANVVAVDKQDRIYVGGQTGHPDFPVAAAGRHLRDNPELNSSDGKQHEAFVVAFDKDLREFLFSTFLGAVRPFCEGVSSCLARTYGSKVLALHPSDAGRLTVLSFNPGLPPTPGSLSLTEGYADHTVPGEPNRGELHYGLASIDTVNPQLVWSADLGAPVLAPSPDPKMAVDNSGHIYVARMGDWKENASATERPQSIDVLKIAANGATLLQRDAFAADTGADLSAFHLAADGTYWLSGNAGPSRWKPIEPEAHGGSQFLMHFLPQTRTVDRYLLIPNGNADVTLRAGVGNTLWLGGRTGFLQALQTTGSTETAILGTANAAAFFTSGRLSPGELISIYGMGFGPAIGEGAVFDANERLPLQLNGVEVRVNGVTCPLLYASDAQINFITPFDEGLYQSTDGMLPLEIRYRGAVRRQAMLKGAEAQPNVFHQVRTWTNPVQQQTFTAPFPILQIYGKGDSAVLRRGDVFTIWMNGAGAWRQSVTDGTKAEAPYNAPKRKLRATIAFSEYGYAAREMTVEYFGAAPGFAAGLLQANIRIPDDFAIPPNIMGYLFLTVGEETPEGFRPVADAPLMRLELSRD